MTDDEAALAGVEKMISEIYRRFVAVDRVIDTIRLDLSYHQLTERMIAHLRVSGVNFSNAPGQKLERESK